MNKRQGHMKSADLLFILNSEMKCCEVVFSFLCFLIYVLAEPRFNSLKTGGWLLYVPPGLTFTNATFCPHNVFMCFVWISEQTEIVSLYRIN
jgi:hypothetical protein